MNVDLITNYIHRIVTNTRLSELDAANIPTDIDNLLERSNIVRTTTIDLNQAAGPYDLFTGTTNPVLIDSLIIRCPDAAAGGSLTSISIQSNDSTPQVLISSSDAPVANLTAQAQIAWTGECYLDTGKKIQLTIAGGATGASYVCTVAATYKAVASGGSLA